VSALPARVRVRVPATTANLGPGFDALGLTLDLWNEAEFQLAGQGIQVRVEGEGAAILPRDGQNLTARAFMAYYRHKGLLEPGGLQIACLNRIPSGSGLGSSASAVILGLLAAGALSGCAASKEELLALAMELEGHGDNAAAALFGGLTVALQLPEGWVVRRYDVPPLRAALALPDIDLPTSQARKALPASVPRVDAVFNSSRTPLVVEALRSGDLDLLGRVMDDRLHQPYRLPLIPGAVEAMAAARQAGAAAVAISGAGPSLIAFCPGQSRPVADAMRAAFERAGVPARAFTLITASRAAEIEND
jgi:homoserine kinase